MKHWYELSLLERAATIQSLNELFRFNEMEPDDDQIADAYLSLEVWPCRKSWVFINNGSYFQLDLDRVCALVDRFVNEQVRADELTQKY